MSASVPVVNTAFTESLVHSYPVPNMFGYRHRCGMIPSGEWDVFMDDFHSFVVATSITNGPAANTPWGWQSAIIDSGSTATVYTTATLGANGVISISDATASEGVAIYGTKSVQLISGKRFFIEMRMYTDDVTDNDFQFGLTDLTATTNPEDLWTTTAANLVTFGILDGSATTGMLADKSNGGTVVQSGSIALTASTWNVLGIGFNGTQLTGWVNGRRSLVWSGAASTIPTAVALAPFFGSRNGDGAGGAVNLIDYIRFSSER